MTLKLDMYSKLDTLESLKKFLGISNISNVFMTSMSDFYVIFQFLATASIIKCVETLHFRIKYRKIPNVRPPRI